MSLSVVFTPEAEDQLVELHRYIAAAGSAEVAARYVDEFGTAPTFFIVPTFRRFGVTRVQLPEVVA